MHGYGIYIYADGIRYEGQYFNDKKDGYGVYKWPDGRIYEGWWSRGKQHGLGVYKDPKKGHRKEGLWENGKRLEWFTGDVVRQIEIGQIDITARLTDPFHSAPNLKETKSFSAPEDFTSKMAQVRLSVKP